MRSTIVKRAIFIVIFALLILFGGELRSEAYLTTSQHWSSSHMAETGTVEATLYDNGTLLISGNGRMKDWNVPSGSYRPWEDGRIASKIDRILIKDGVQNIGNYAFYGCDNLKFVNIQGIDVKIGNNAFRECSSLRVVFREDDEDYCNNFLKGKYPNAPWEASISVSDIGNAAFWGCEALERLWIGGSITKIGDYAFENCTNFQELQWEEETPNLSVIGTEAFANCSKLSKFSFSSNWTEIGKNAFENCVGFRSITIKNRQIRIGVEAFKGCNCTIYGYDNSTAHTYAQNNQMEFQSIDNLTISMDISKKQDGSLMAEFKEPTKVLEIKGSGEMKNWNKYAEDIPFWWQEPYFSIIETISFSGNISNIGDNAFSYLSNVKKIVIPYGVETIGGGNFIDCSSLQLLYLPPTLKKLDSTDIRTYGRNFTVKAFHNTPADNLVASEDMKVDFFEETKTWDISANGDGSITGTLDFVTGVLTISGNGTMADYGYIYDVSPWRSGVDFYEGTNYDTWIKKVVIEDGVTSLGDFCLACLNNITDIMIPDSVTQIGSSIFAGCDNLTNVTFLHANRQPAITVEQGMFSGLNTENVSIGCIANSSVDDFLNSIDISYSNINGYDISATNSHVTAYVIRVGHEEDVLYVRGQGATKSYNQNLNWVYPYTDGDYPPWLYNPTYLNTIKTIIIEEGVTEIGVDTFRFLSWVNKIEIPDSMEIIHEGAFHGSTSLATLVLPSKGIERIDEGAFYNGENERTFKVVINGVEGDGRYINVGTKIFVDWNNVGDESSTNVNATFGYHAGNDTGKLTITGQGAIGGAGDKEVPWSISQTNVKVTSVEIGDEITKIGDKAFYGLADMTNVTIGNKVQTIGSNAFRKCTKLTSIALNNTQEIGSYAFADCSALTNFTETGNLIKIGSNAFQNCSGLTSVSLINTSDFGEYAFSGCSSLESFSTDSRSGLTFGEYAFNNCSKLKTVTTKERMKVEETTFVECPEDLVLSWYEWQQWGTPYYQVTYAFRDSSLTLKYEPGHVGERDYDAANNIKPSWHKDDFKIEIKKVRISNGIKRIGNQAFKDMTDVAEASIETNLTSIGNSAFENCQRLEKINIPATVTNIGDTAFRGCSSLTSITIPASVTSIGDKAFEQCSENLTIRCYKNSTAHIYAKDNHIKYVLIDGDDDPGTEENISPNSISLNRTSVTLDLNGIKEITLQATISPSNANVNTGITWSSDNTDIATVDANGKVTAVAKGTCIITARTENGKVATCSVTVTKDDGGSGTEEKISPNSISLNKTNVTLDLGGVKETTLQATISPSNANVNTGITWSSDNTDIATVDANGKVTAVAKGTCIITARTENGKVATCNVTVTRDDGGSGNDDDDPGDDDNLGNGGGSGNQDGSGNQGGSGNQSGSGTSLGNGNTTGGNNSKFTGTLSTGGTASTNKTTTNTNNISSGASSDSLSDKIIPKTGYQKGLLIGIVILSTVAILCYRKSK